MTHSSSEHFIKQQAKNQGIHTQWTNEEGQVQLVNEKTYKALLSAMGVSLSSESINTFHSSEHDSSHHFEFENASSNIKLEPVWVVSETSETIEFPIKVSHIATRHKLHCRLQTENGQLQEWDFSPHLSPSQLRYSGFTQCTVTIPTPIKTGYHEVYVQDKQTGQHASMKLILTPPACYQSPALVNTESGQQPTRLWGINLDLPTIMSQRNWGYGDFTDLQRIIDWCASQGAEFIHINGCRSESSHYWHFLLLDIEAIEDFSECDEARKLVFSPTFQNELKKLRNAISIDIQAIIRQKLEVLHILYRNFNRHHLKKNSFRAHSYKTYIQKNGKKLENFALYQALQEYFEREDPTIQGWEDWPDAYQNPNNPTVIEFSLTNQERLEFYRYLQWQLDIQLHAAGLRSLEHGLSVGLCLNFDWGISLSPAEVWSHRALFAKNCHLGSPSNISASKEEYWKPPPILPRQLKKDRYHFFIEAVRHKMQHAGAIHIRNLTSLLRQFWVPGNLLPRQGSYVDYPFDDLLGILALESHRHSCLVLGDDISDLPEELQARFAAWKIFPSQTFYPNAETISLDESKITSTREPADFSPMTLLSIRNQHTPTLFDFWGGKDITQHSQPIKYSKEQRDIDLKKRALFRVNLLEQLERYHLLPSDITPEPLSAPQMTPELSASIHHLAAESAAKLFSIHLNDLIFMNDNPSGTAEITTQDTLKKCPLPLEAWWSESSISSICNAISQERPHYACPIKSGLLPCLEPPQRTSLLIPRAIYRLQLNQHFTFRDAANLIPYLNHLGISHCYVSPLLKARPSSPHGYDITDHKQLNPDLGSMDDFKYLTDKLRMHGMGLIVDIVPNHMGAGKDNPWWNDVLENGMSSLYAEYFDIDWNPLSDDLQNKILLAILGDSYGKILENGDINLQWETETGRFWLHYWEHSVPIDPVTAPLILGHRLEILETRLGHQENALLEYRSILSAFENLPVETQHNFSIKEERAREKTVAFNRLMHLYQKTPELLQFIEENVQDFQPRKDDPTSLNRLNRLLERQNYRLANWRVASDEINYRRFFDINDLVAVRVEDEQVFQDTHELILTLIEQGQIQGIRIDHPDGLYDPAHYFYRLQTANARRLDLQEQTDWHLGSPELPFYILIEKILTPFEHLPEDWAVHGTTGYDFTNALQGLFIQQETEKELTRIYEKFIGQRIDFDELCYENKKLIMKTALNSELGVLTHQLHRISKTHWSYQDFTLHNLRSALIEVIACFPVYRTYVTGKHISRKDAEYIEWAIRAAKRKNLSTDGSVFDFIHTVLLTDTSLTHDTEENAVVHFAMKFQQYTGPVMAKGVEDTAFYRYNRLVSLNEVGSDPKQFGISVAHFHYQNIDRLKKTPHTLLSTSTHDTKRSEDVRSRLSVLSEMPQEFAEHVQYWRRSNRPFRKQLEDGILAPSSNDEYLIYQTLLGLWPFHAPNESEVETLITRLEQYLIKAVREAKEYSSWMNPNLDYESALSEFIRNIFLRPSKLFLEDFSIFHRNIARFGALNSISQTLLKLTCPGVPDIYQGTELFTFTLVDPDNRQTVDFSQHLQSLRQIDDMLDLKEQHAFHQQLESLCQDLSDSRLKQFIISTTLRFRSAQPPLFREGEYIPLEVTGHHAEHIVAFARCWHGLSAIIVVPRLLYSLGLRKKDRPFGRRIWRDTAIILPEQLANQSFRNIFDRQMLAPSAHPTTLIADILQHLPVGLLVAN